MPRQDSIVIEMNNITKSYGRIKALRGVNLTAKEGEILGLLGPNGAGKTTIMKILTCFTPPTSGTFKVGGLDGRRDSLAVRSLTGYMPEHNPLYLDMAVSGFLGFIGGAKSLTGSSRKDHIERVMAQCGLEKVKGRIIKHLSKGYRQRVGLAQAIIGDPLVLILDEPTIGLDPGQVVEMRRLIKEMGERKTVILSSHILSEVSQICDRVVIMNQGKILAQDPPKTLIQQLARSIEVGLEIRGEPQLVMTTLQKVRGVRSVVKGEGNNRFNAEVDRDEEVRSHIAKALLKEGFDLLEMRVKEMDLEDIFLHVVGHKERKRQS